jgi:hypothetical protein
VTEAHKHIAAGIGFREIGRSFLREGGMKAAKRVARGFARLRRAMQSMRAGMAMAPLNGGVVEVHTSAAGRPSAVKQHSARGDRARLAPAMVSLRTGLLPPAEKSEAAEVARDGGAVHSVVQPLARYATIGKAAATGIARAVNGSLPNFTSRSSRVVAPSSSQPVGTRARQSETESVAELTMHVVAAEKTNQRVHEHAWPEIAHARSRIAAIARVSLAPTKTAVVAGTTSAAPRPQRSNTMTDGVSAAQANAALDERQLNRLIADQLERIAMRPSAGMTGYDPRVSPSYPGAPSDV